MRRAGRLWPRPRQSAVSLRLEEDQPERLHVGGAVGKRPLHGELPADMLVGAGSARDSDRERRLEVGFPLELDLPVAEDQSAMAQDVEPARADCDVDTIQHAAVGPPAVLEVDRGLDHLVAGAWALL